MSRVIFWCMFNYSFQHMSPFMVFYFVILGVKGHISKSVNFSNKRQYTLSYWTEKEVCFSLKNKFWSVTYLPCNCYQIIFSYLVFNDFLINFLWQLICVTYSNISGIGVYMLIRSTAIGFVYYHYSVILDWLQIITNKFFYQ